LSTEETDLLRSKCKDKSLGDFGEMSKMTFSLVPRGSLLSVIPGQTFAFTDRVRVRI